MDTKAGRGSALFDVSEYIIDGVGAPALQVQVKAIRIKININISSPTYV